MKCCLVPLLLIANITLTGCGSSTEAPSSSLHADDNDEPQSHGDEHAHTEEGPHHGALIELGNGEYHAELVQDDAASIVTAYVLDSSAKLAVPISATEILVNLSRDGHAEQFALAANPQSGDPSGKSSRFASTDAEHAENLGDAAVTAQLVVKIGGKQYRGAIGHGHDHTAGHSHGPDDALVWRRSDIQYARYAISLGHHSKLLYPGKPVEPAISITQNGTPISDAQVHNSLWSGDGKTLLAKEVRTTYEPPTVEEPAHYAQGNLNIPSDAKKVVIRFRVVLPGDAGEVSYDLHVLTEQESSVAGEDVHDYR